MSAGAIGGTTGAAGAAAAARRKMEAIKASGVVVRVESEVFLDVLQSHEAPLVVTATYGIFSAKYKYLTSYKGLAFYCKSSDPLELPGHCEIIKADKISHPEL